MNLGFMFQVFNNPASTIAVLKSVRKFYPDNLIIVISDNGYNFTDICRQYHCEYIHSTTATGAYFINGLASMKSYVDRQLYVCSILQASGCDYVLRLEDDVFCLKKYDPVGIDRDTDNLGSHEVMKVTLYDIIHNTNCGGSSIIKVSSYIEALQNFYRINLVNLAQIISYDVLDSILLATVLRTKYIYAKEFVTNKEQITDDTCFIHPMKDFYQENSRLFVLQNESNLDFKKEPKCTD